MPSLTLKQLDRLWNDCINHKDWAGARAIRDLQNAHPDRPEYLKEFEKQEQAAKSA